MTKQPVVYLGGPIDYSVPAADAWRHDPEWEKVYKVYCPRCECMGLTDEQVIVQNMAVLKQAAMAVFDLTFHSVGTPIEMFLRCWIYEKPAVLIAKEGVFVRETQRRYGTPVVPTKFQAQQLLVEGNTNG